MDGIGYMNDAGCLIGEISKIIEKIGIPNNADCMVYGKLFDEYQNNKIDHYDLMDVVVGMTNALIDIQKLLKAYYEE